MGRDGAIGPAERSIEQAGLGGVEQAVLVRAQAKRLVRAGGVGRPGLGRFG